MKPEIFEVMKGIIGTAKCSFIGEIGTHKAYTARQLIGYCAQRVKTVTYHGYDIFDQHKPDPEFHRQERNGKAPASMQYAESMLSQWQFKNNNLQYKLFQGLTTDTLKPTKFDFVYIDGGHSYDTVKYDYEQVKHSKLIVFDDVKITGVNKFVHELMDQGVAVELVRTPSKHTWAVVRN